MKSIGKTAGQANRPPFMQSSLILDQILRLDICALKVGFTDGRWWLGLTETDNAHVYGWSDSNRGVDQDVEEGCDGAARVVCVDWNSVQLEDTTDLVIAPMADTEMAKFFGIPVDPVDDQDEEERDESSLPNDANRDACEDVDGQLMKDAADDAHEAELVSVYDKENPVIEVGKLSPSMKEFRMSFKTYADKH